MADRIPFVVIGENVHATRIVKRDGRHVGGGDGSEHVVFVDAKGQDRIMPMAGPVRAGSDFEKGNVKHVRNALLLGLGGDHVLPADMTGDVDDELAQIGRDYLIAVAVRQQSNGAHYIDLNVDELDGDPAIQKAAIEWAVTLLEPELDIPLALDSSSAAVLAAGLRISNKPNGPLLINSASAERLDTLDIAAETVSPVVLSAAGVGTLPSDAAGRIGNSQDIVSAALERGIPLSNIHVDPLVIPVAVDSNAGTAYLDAVRAVRSEYGPEIRITGGLSNISFGLPNRRLLNEAFVAIAVDAGVDSGIINPNGLNVEKALATDRGSDAFKSAADVLNGVDQFAMEYLTAFRSGKLS
jgi:5-methyltetrahydrofolate--homocysteine methyltransferase